jgi:hypothetical protein
MLARVGTVAGMNDDVLAAKRPAALGVPQPERPINADEEEEGEVVLRPRTQKLGASIEAMRLYHDKLTAIQAKIGALCVQ